MLPSSYITDNLASATISAIHDAKPSLKEVDEGIFAKVRGSTEMQAHIWLDGISKCDISSPSPSRQNVDSLLHFLITVCHLLHMSSLPPI